MYSLIEMSMFRKVDTKLPVNLWIDEDGERNPKHNLSRLKSQLYLNEQKIQLDLTKEELSLLDYLTYHECHKIENLYEERSPKMETMNKLRSKVIDLAQKNRDKISSTL